MLESESKTLLQEIRDYATHSCGDERERDDRHKANDATADSIKESAPVVISRCETHRHTDKKRKTKEERRHFSTTVPPPAAAAAHSLDSILRKRFISRCLAGSVRLVWNATTADKKKKKKRRKKTCYSPPIICLFQTFFITKKREINKKVENRSRTASTAFFFV